MVPGVVVIKLMVMRVVVIISRVPVSVMVGCLVVIVVAPMGGAMTEKIIKVNGAIAVRTAMHGVVLVLLVRGPAILMVRAVMGVVLLVAIVEVE